MASSLFIGLFVLLFLLNLSTGSVDIPVADVVGILLGGEAEGQGVPEAWRFIVLHSRLPAAVTAVCAGMSLAVSGLILQTLFRNPLAGPSVFGINSGASLAVSILIMAAPALALQSGVTGQMAVIAAAIIGSVAILVVIIAISHVVRSNTMLLIVGLMIGYLSSSVIAILSYFTSQQSLQEFTVWGLGTFASTTTEQLPILIAFTAVTIAVTLLYIKPLNAVLLGDNYAMNMGYNPKSIRNQLLILSSLLTGATVSFCGPIAFLGLAIPHIARLSTRTDNHRRLLPATILAGANTALLCNLIAANPFTNTPLPVNAITPVIGAPIIIWIILRK